MQRKKNIALSISLVALIVASLAVYYFNQTGGVMVDPMKFRVEDFSAINKVVLTSPDGKVILSTDGTRWTVNDSMPADRNLIDVLFATMQQAEPKRPVASRLSDSLVSRLSTDGVHVELFADGQLLKAFDAGGNSSRSEAYFKEPGEATPYVVVIPGYRVYVSGIFEVDAAGWRNRYVFGFNWQNFKELIASFPKDGGGGFRVVKDNTGVSMVGLVQPDTARLNDFLDDVSLLTVERFTKTKADSMVSLVPIMRIIVRDVANREYALDLFQEMENTGFYPGLVNRRDPALFEARKIKSILHTEGYFSH